jgi:hypothetical protein
MTANKSEWTPPAVPYGWKRTQSDAPNFRGLTSESHLCVDCGFNTAPGLLNRAEAEAYVRELGILWDKGGASIPGTIDANSEVYMVRESVWKKTGLEGYGGCLCIGCLEKRIGRRLKPKDFNRDHSFHSLPGTPRLRNRRDRDYQGSFLLERGPNAFEAFASCDESLGVFATEQEAGKALFKATCADGR